MGILDRAAKVVGSFVGGFQRKAVDTFSSGYQWARRRLSFSYDWASRSGYSGNSLVYACIHQWGTAMATAVPEMRRPSPDGQGAIIPNHPLVEILERPNRFQTWEEFIYLSMVYLGIAGNAYWQKGKNPSGQVVELWCLRPDWIEPISLPNTDEWIDHYQYDLPGGKRQIIPPADMVHHRMGADPNNPRKGLPPLAPIMAEVGLDHMTTTHVTALLENYAVPGVILSVKKKLQNAQEAEIIKQGYMSKLGGYRRGEPMVVDQETAVTLMSQSMREMAMPDLQDVNETRICAAFNVPPIVAGANVGLKRGTYANYGQAREAFWDECVGSLLRQFKGKIKQSLQPDFDTRNLFGWNLGEVRALQEDEEKRRRFFLDSFKVGAITRGEFATAIGLTVPQDADYYLIPGGAKEREEGVFPEPVDPAQLPPPQPIRALPAPKLLACKQADHGLFAGMTVRLRDQLAPGFEAALVKYFDRLGQKVDSRARAQAAKVRTMPGQERKDDEALQIAILLAVESLITARDAAELAALFGDQYALVLELLWTEINGAIGLHDTFSAGDPFVQEFAARAAQRVTGITDVTRAVLRAQIERAQAGGYGVDDLIRGVVDKETGDVVIKPLRDVVSGAGLYPGIYDRAYAEEHGRQVRRGASTEEAERIAGEYATRAASDYRALNIARTELGYAANAGSTARYKASGIVLAVRVYDGDDCGWRSHDDPDKAHGSIRTLEEAEMYTLAHPSCQRAFGPIVDASELPEDWGQLGSAA